jgi:hypothetical protein
MSFVKIAFHDEHHKKISYLDECKKSLKYIGKYPIKKNKSNHDSGLRPISASIYSALKGGVNNPSL